MWLKQKEYLFELNRDNDSEESILNLNCINLKVNGKLTSVKLDQLFAKTNVVEFTQKTNSLRVKGYSVLQILKENKFVIEDQNIEIEFYAPEFGSLILKSIKNSWLMLNDIEMTEDSIQDFNKNILKLATPEVVEEAIVEDPEPQPETVVTIKEEEKIEEIFISVKNNTYEKLKLPYLKNEYKEYDFENYRLLLWKNENEFKAILFNLINSESLEKFINPERIGEDFVNFYRFDNSNESKFINAKIIANKLDISFKEYEKEIEQEIVQDEI